MNVISPNSPLSFLERDINASQADIIASPTPFNLATLPPTPPTTLQPVPMSHLTHQTTTSPSPLLPHPNKHHHALPSPLLRARQRLLRTTPLRRRRRWSETQAHPHPPLLRHLPREQTQMYAPLPAVPYSPGPNVPGDRTQPCSQCLKKGRASSCAYVPKPARPPAAPRSMTARLKRLEAMVRGMMDGDGDGEREEQQELVSKSGGIVVDGAPREETHAQVVFGGRARTTYVGATHFMAMLDDVSCTYLRVFVDSGLC